MKTILFLLIGIFHSAFSNEPSSYYTNAIDHHFHYYGYDRVSAPTEDYIRSVVKRIFVPEILLIRKLNPQIIQNESAMHVSNWSQLDHPMKVYLFQGTVIVCMYVDEEAFNKFTDTEKEFIIVKSMIDIGRRDNTIVFNGLLPYFSFYVSFFSFALDLDHPISLSQHFLPFCSSVCSSIGVSILSYYYLSRNLDKEAHLAAIAVLKTNEGAISYYKKLQEHKKKCKLDLPPNQRSRWKITKYLLYPFTWRHTYKQKLAYIS